MGFIQPKRIQVRLLRPDLALVSPGGQSLSQFEAAGGGKQHYERPKV